MKRRRAWLAFVGICLACACRSERDQPASNPASAAPAASTAPAPVAAPEAPAVDAAYGVVPGRRTIDGDTVTYIREPGYPAGVFAVPLPGRPQLLAFDVNSNIAGICTRIDQTPFELPNGNVTYARFRCPGTWDSRNVVFLDATAFLPSRGEQLEWTALAGPSPLPMPGAKQTADLHDYAAIARSGLLNDRLLVSAAWFSGKYLPGKEFDDLRGDSIAFGHYQLLDRALFIGESPQQPSTLLYRSTGPTEVREGLEWAFLPRNASEKAWATVSALYEIPTGYLVRVSMSRDHEGFGLDESTYLYAYETGRWRLLARAENTRLY